MPVSYDAEGEVKNGTHQPLSRVRSPRCKRADAGCAVSCGPPARGEREILRRDGERFAAELERDARGRIARHSPGSRTLLDGTGNLGVNRVNVCRRNDEESGASIHDTGLSLDSDVSAVDGDSVQLGDPKVIVRSVESNECTAVELGGIHISGCHVREGRRHGRGMRTQK